MQLSRYLINTTLSTSLIFTLTACGGGSGSTSDTVAAAISSLTAAPTPTQSSSADNNSSVASSASNISSSIASSIANNSSLVSSTPASSTAATSAVSTASIANSSTQVSTSSLAASSAKISSSVAISSSVKSSIPSNSSMASSSAPKSSSSIASSSAVKSSSAAAVLSSSSAATSSSSSGAQPIAYATHEAAEDYTWDTSSETKITFYDTSIVVAGSGASVDKTIVTINAAGNYHFTGKLLNGQILVNTKAEETVRLIFDAINISNSTTAPVSIVKANKVVVVLAAGSKNYLADPATYVFASGEDEPNAALFSKANLTIAGTGELIVDANYNDAIASKDGLLIHSGTINVDAIDDGIRGKDYLVIQDGTIAVTSGGDSLKSDNEDLDSGIMAIAGGTFKLTSTAGDTISGETAVQISGGNFTLKTGSNGSSTALTDTSNSMKAVKATGNLNIFNGTFAIDSADDALHANANITLNGGNFTIATGDDGVHADTNLTINAGTVNITKSYEGLESGIITINSGNIHVTSSDDGINVAGGAGTETQIPGTRPGDNFTGASTYFMYINGGYVYVNANGDGLDANGSIVMTGGTVIVNGPTANNNAPLDYDGTFTISGGYLVAAGSSGMAQAPSTSSTQNSVKVTFSSSQTANKLINIQSAAGVSLLTFAPVKNYSSVVLSTPNLVTGTAYDIYQGGASTGTLLDGLYSGGTYSGGTKAVSFTPSAKVTNVSK